MKQSTVSMRIRIENLCIGIIFLFSLMLFALSFFHRPSAEAAVLVSTEMELDGAASGIRSSVLSCQSAEKEKTRGI